MERVSIAVWLFVAIFAFSTTNIHAQIQSPAEFLGYSLGDRLTPHHRVMAYYEHIAANSDFVETKTYGFTYGQRELKLAFVTSPSNHQNLEDIRLDNLKRTGLMDGSMSGVGDKAIVWLSYNVHGNEISSTEASMQTIYELVTQRQEWLEDTVVIIDPLLNPDGRERFVNFFHQVTGRNPDPYPNSREHNEPWPNGRTNYYHFDLNRDWAWQSQIETQNRIKVYHEWMPHVHADFHEMGFNNPYYFAPAAEPFHEAITDWQRQFQIEIGRNHANYFDEKFRLYYTRENFDLFYPSYGDTYPTYNGAIGMTYEQAGHSRGGLAVITALGDTLTFDRRILNQHIVGMSTVEIAAENAGRVAREFQNFFSETSQNPYSEYKTFIIRGDQNRDKLALLVNSLMNWDIRYGSAPQTRSVRAYNYKTGETESISLSSDDIIISAYQPKSVLTNVLFEPQTTVIDSLTYDITAWSVPYAMGLEAFATTERIRPAIEWNLPEIERPEISSNVPYSYILRWESEEDAKFLSYLLKNDVRVRFTKQPFSIDGNNFERGSLVIVRRGNESIGTRFDEIVQRAANHYDRQLFATQTGMVQSGVDFGSDDVSIIERPRIALIGGSGFNGNNFGEIWHYFDVRLEYPISTFDGSQFNASFLNDFNVIILPEGNSGSFLNRMGSEFSTWLSRGGKVIAFGSSINGFTSSDIPGSVSFRDRETNEEPNLIQFSERSREAIQNSISGSIYKIYLDNTHPLAFGYPDYYYTIKRGSNVPEYLNSGWNVGRLQAGAHRAGFEGYKVKEHVVDSMVFGVEQSGRGSIVYLADNPLFRAFWHNGHLLFANSVFFVGN